MAERLNFDNRGLQTGLDVGGIAADFELQLIANRRQVFANAIASGDFKTGVYNQLNAYNDASRDAALKAFRELTEVTSEHLQATHKAGKDTIDAGVRRFERAGYKSNLQPVQRDRTALETFLGITLGAFLGAITQAQSAAQNQMMQITQLVRPGEDPRQEIDRVQGVFLQRGITVPSGGVEKALPSYIEFTERNQSQKLLLAAEGERAEEYGLHYAQISGHPSSCPKCTPWQLKIVIDDVFQAGKPDGKTPLMSQAINEGLFHFNCRHERTVFIPGFDKERLQAKDVASPKETATRYAIEQMQRYNERGIREWKMREAAAMTDTEKRLAEMKVREWQAKQHALRKIAKEEGVPFYRQYSREQIGGDTPPTIKPEVLEYKNALMREKESVKEVYIFPYGEKAQSVVESKETKNLKRKTEKATAVDADGNILLEKAGDKTSVRFTKEELDGMRGAIFSHNHPSRDTVLSPEDVQTAIKFQFKEIRATSPDGDVIILRAKDITDRQNAIRFIGHYASIFDDVNKNARIKMPKNEQPYPDTKGIVYQEYPWYNNYVRNGIQTELEKDIVSYGYEYYVLRRYLKIE